MLVGLWPLDFFPKNNVNWLAGGNGVHFQCRSPKHRSCAGGVALSAKPVVIPQQLVSKKGSISIEIWLRPDAEPTPSIARIVGFYHELKNETLFVGQWKSGLVVRGLVVGPDNRRQRKEIGKAGVLLAGKTRFVTVTSDQKGSAIYLEGKLVAHFPRVRLIGHNGSFEGWSIRLGNSAEANAPWFGKLFGLGLYNSAMNPGQALQSFREWAHGISSQPNARDGAVATYDFSEGSGIWAHSIVGCANSLMVPPLLQFERRFLIPPKISSVIETSGIKDIVANIAGFIPLGYFFSSWLSTRKKVTSRAIYTTVLALGVFVSLTVELVQGYLPTRNSSQVDLMCNALGAFLGVTVFRFFHFGTNEITRNKKLPTVQN